MSGQQPYTIHAANHYPIKLSGYIDWLAQPPWNVILAKYILHVHIDISTSLRLRLRHVSLIIYNSTIIRIYDLTFN